METLRNITENGKSTILIVDDEVVSSRLLESSLSDYFNVVTVE